MWVTRGSFVCGEPALVRVMPWAPGRLPAKVASIIIAMLQHMRIFLSRIGGNVSRAMGSDSRNPQLAEWYYGRSWKVILCFIEKRKVFATVEAPTL